MGTPAERGIRAWTHNAWLAMAEWMRVERRQRSFRDLATRNASWQAPVGRLRGRNGHQPAKKMTLCGPASRNPRHLHWRSRLAKLTARWSQVGRIAEFKFNRRGVPAKARCDFLGAFGRAPSRCWRYGKSATSYATRRPDGHGYGACARNEGYRATCKAFRSSHCDLLQDRFRRQVVARETRSVFGEHFARRVGLHAG